MMKQAIASRAKVAAISVLLAMVAAPPSFAQKSPRDVKIPDPTAETAQAANSPVSADPDMTTAAFGDWVLRCIRVKPQETGERLCEVSQSLIIEGGQGTVAQLAIGRRAEGQPLLLTTVLPNNVAFPSLVRLLVEVNDSQPLELAWTRCIPGACVAQLQVDELALERLTGRASGGQLGFTDANGNDVVLPISLRGLAQAIDALSLNSSNDG